MIKPVLTILLAGVLFLAMILNLALKPRFYARLTGVLMGISVLGGLILYGYGFAVVLEDPILAVFRTAFAIGNMFIGKNEVGVVSAAPWFAHTWVMTFFWLCHLFAFYTTASAAFVTLGNEAMKKIRLFLVRRGRLVVVYGCQETALTVARGFEKQNGISLVYVTEQPEDAARLSGVVRNDSAALKAEVGFLKSIGVNKKRKIELYAVHPDSPKSIAYAKNFRDSLAELGVDPANTSLTMRGWEDNGELFQVLGERYGFGYVKVFDIPELAARTAMLHCPVWENIRFDADGKALEDVHALVIGFGRMGQAMLQSLTINSQFYGSHFKAAVFSRELEADRGFLAVEAPALFENYDIIMQEGDGRSPKVYQYLEENLDSINYICIGVGGESMTHEVAETMWRFLKRRGKAIPMVVCSSDGVRVMNSGDSRSDYYSLLTPENLSGETLDRLPMLLNHAYCGNDKTPWENWVSCDSFSRRSCRSAADFFPGLYYSIGLDEDEARENWKLSKKQKEILGRHEHLRWCAFHYVNGFSTMTEEEWTQRARIYQKQKEETGKGSIRLGKNMTERTHACLISWEELKDLDARETAITGKAVDYQQMDITNVMMIPQLLEEKRR